MPFPVQLSTLIRSQFQAKPATLLIPVIFPFRLAVEELYSTRYQSGSFSLINVGSGFHCLRSFFFFLFSFLKEGTDGICWRWYGSSLSTSRCVATFKPHSTRLQICLICIHHFLNAQSISSTTIITTWIPMKSQPDLNNLGKMRHAIQGTHCCLFAAQVLPKHKTRVSSRW